MIIFIFYQHAPAIRGHVSNIIIPITTAQIEAKRSNAVALSLVAEKCSFRANVAFLGML